jgi:beta-glucosidase
MPHSLLRLKPVAAALCLALAAPSCALAAPLYLDRGAAVEARVEDLLGRLTQDEKLALLGGDREFYIRAVPRLHLPAIKMADGPLGVRNYGKSTAYPATVALAASWDAALARDFGTAIGRDARARGVHIMLGPGVNIQRVPQNGRNFEYLSEDPYLSARLGVNIIEAMQGQGIAATVKHYAANNQETERMSVDARVGERALREIYLPAFEAAVKEAKVWAVMNAYNRLNGEHATANGWLNNHVLKQEWSFPGVLMSDWDATHDTLGAANGGLDLEMPFGLYLNSKKLKPLLADGQVSQATIDDKVRRILRLEIGMGFLDRKQADASIPKDDPASAAVAYRIAQEGTVLLKNENAALPLHGAVRKLVVIGPMADIAAAGGGSSQVAPFHATTFLAAVKAAAAKQGVQVDYIAGKGLNPAPRVLAGARFDGPLTLELFNGKELEGAVVASRQVKHIRENWSGHAPAPGLGKSRFSARWSGSITAPADGDYSFAVQSDDGSRVFLDDQLLLDFWTDHGLDSKLATIHLKAGSSHKLRVEYMQEGGEAIMRFGWGPAQTGPQLSPAETEKIRAADAVIVAAGYSNNDESEGADRSYELPYHQPELIQAVTEANPRTVVVLNSGGRVATSGWIEKVPALMQAWFPGQNGNGAIADMLFGRISPSGKLPFTYERRMEDSAAYGNYPGAAGQVSYEEGIFVGYRWADRKQVEPLFPFGHGLSYTHFDYSAPQIQQGPEGKVVLTFRVTNSGSMAGAEVAQVYVEPPPSAVPRPVRELKGFARLALKPGESGEASVTLDQRAFAYFSEQDKGWKTAPGRYTLTVGASSRDPRLQIAVERE